MISDSEIARKINRNDIKKWVMEHGYPDDGEAETFVEYIRAMIYDLSLILIDPNGMGLSAISLLQQFEEVKL